MAARLTDRQKKKIIADYVELQSYNAVAKKNNVTHQTVKRVVSASPEFTKIAQQKKEKNTADVLAYMDEHKDLVCSFIGLGLEALNDPNKIKSANLTQITTAMGTLIDKWALISGAPVEKAKDDALSESLRELAEGLTSDDQP
mgnify:CR=1 FL=1